jgi:uncharacterized membrane protein
MKSLFIGYLAALATLAVLDALWLGVVSRDFYKARLGELLLDQPNWPVAILFYLVHAVGVVVFPVPLAASWLSAVLYGALFGFVVYAAYDLTNLATLRGWPMAVSLVDLAWEQPSVRRPASQPSSRFALRHKGARASGPLTRIHMRA